MNFLIRMGVLAIALCGSLDALDLLLDAPQTNGTLPLAFRTVLDPFPLTELVNIPSREGLEALKASGSSQFSKGELETLATTLGKKKLIIVDLREESHGYIDGAGVTWYGKQNRANNGKQLAEIIDDETRRLKRALRDKRVEMKPNRSGRAKRYSVHSAVSEETLATELGIQYVRIPVQDNCGPNVTDVNRFIQFLKEKPKNAWVHFHCRQGMGRTTSFLVLYDMIVNAKTVALDDIARRHALLGGFNLLYMPKFDDPYLVCHMQRRALMIQFYNYCRENSDDFATPFVLK